MIKHLPPFIFFLIFLFSGTHAAVLVVSNIPGSGQKYSSIQSAVEHASPNDTIFVMGSPLNYGNVLLEKPLTLIAEGFLEESPTGHTAKLTRVLLTSNPYRRTISSGSSILGFEFPYFPGQRPNIVTVANARVKIEDVTIERNWIWFVEVVGSAQNWEFKNNVIRGWVNGGGSEHNPDAGGKDFYFFNNILNTLKGFKDGKIHVENNVILGRIKDVQAAYISNNIFTRDDYIIDNVYNSRFMNNIVMGAKVGNPECYEHNDRFETRYLCAGKSNMGAHNKISTDAGFVYWPSDDIMGGNVFKLNANAAARRGGVNGYQAGIFGGPYPFPDNAFLNMEIENPFPTFVTSIY